VIIFFSFSQFILIFCGWLYLLDLLLDSYPEHPLWLEATVIRAFGLILGMLFVVYPVYFGIFGLGFETRRPSQKQPQAPS